MANLARAASRSDEIARYAQQFVHGWKPGVLEAIDARIRQQFRYRSENEEVIRTPEWMVGDLETLGYLEGDCDDIATFYAAVLKAFGFRVRLVAIRYDETPEFKHVFVEVLNVGWERVDPTVAPGTVHHETERMILEV